MHKPLTYVSLPVRAVRVLSEPDACVYLPGRVARHEYLFAADVNPESYHRLMDLNYRRAGDTIYRPVCPGCGECRPLRVPAAEFRPDRSQRRNLRTNADIEVSVGAPALDPERADLYRRYQVLRHRDDEGRVAETLANFLYATCVETLEWRFRLGGRLVMVSINDLSAWSLSAVYCYYDPALARRGLGTFNVLSLLAFARTEGIPFVYLGFHVRHCAKMSYKSRFRPFELLGQDRVWRSAAQAATSATHGGSPSPLPPA